MLATVHNRKVNVCDTRCWNRYRTLIADGLYIPNVAYRDSLGRIQLAANREEWSLTTNLCVYCSHPTQSH